MTESDALLAGIVSDPLEETRWLVLADWLEENDDPRRAELLRLHRKLLGTCLEPDAHPERAAWQARIVKLLGAGVAPCVPREALVLPGGVPLALHFVPPGAFRMGSVHPDGYENERPVHRVTLTRGFFLGACPVTQTQWSTVMRSRPSVFWGPSRPVEAVSWEDAQAFCAKVSGVTGRRVGLPTEAEWEWACRAGTTSEFHFGHTVTTHLANFNGTHTRNGSPEGKHRQATTDVGSFPPNPWGIHDLHGNVLEWCADVYTEYAPGDQTDPHSEINHSGDNFRVLRGGSWDDIPRLCRAPRRGRSAPADRYLNVGFRVCFRLD